MAQAPSNQPGATRVRTIVRWGLYPFSWLIVLSGFYVLLTSDRDPGTIWAMCIGVLAPLYLAVEFIFPYERRWAMTFRSFVTDLKYVVVNVVFVSLMSAALAIFTITMAGRDNGLAANWPVLPQVVLMLLIFEACNYGLHRFMHEGHGGPGRVMWRLHAAHHMPPRLYLFMHAVFHPLNGIIIQGVAVVLPIWLVGYSENAVVMFVILNGMHGLLSHFNVDIRMGWMNYVFVGPELHRYHHSADVHEAKNYGATLPIYDLIFGTFVYHPARAPKQLGVDAGAGLPAYEQVSKVMRLPFSAW